MLSALFLSMSPDVLLRAAQGQRERFQAWSESRPFLFAAGYFAAYVAFTGLSLPGALFLTILGGMLLPFWEALLIVSCASTLGATIAFLSARHLLRERIWRRHAGRLAVVRREFDLAGGYYLLSLRLNPFFPYVFINLLFGLTTLPASKFWLISQFGMLPTAVMYLLAGKQLAAINSVRQIFAPEMVALLVGASVLPLAARVVAARLARRKALTQT